MVRYFILFVPFVFSVPCFAEEMPSVPELLKKMYDYRMAIENMQAEVTVTTPVDTVQPFRKKIKQHYYFAFDKGRVRCDITRSNFETPNIWFYQHLSTPEFYFIRHPSKVPEVNDGNSLFLRSPLKQSFDTLDPRRLGTDWKHFDTILIDPFSYDALMGQFFSPKGEDFHVSIDLVDDEGLYKISYKINGGKIINSYWINPQKGYNLVRGKSESEELDRHDTYIVTLEKFKTQSGEIWFPRQIVYQYKLKNNLVEERIVLDSVAFDVRDEKPFTLAGLDIPVGYRVEYFSEGARYWDGKELVDEIPVAIESVNVANRRTFWMINAVGFAILATVILTRYFRLRNG